MPDFDLFDHDHRYVLVPLTDAAQTWVIEHIQDGPMNEGDAVFIDQSFIDDIVSKIHCEGMTVE